MQCERISMADRGDSRVRASFGGGIFARDADPAVLWKSRVPIAVPSIFIPSALII
jgi:hypothetical protein